MVRVHKRGHRLSTDPRLCRPYLDFAWGLGSNRLAFGTLIG